MATLKTLPFTWSKPARLAGRCWSWRAAPVECCATPAAGPSATRTVRVAGTQGLSLRIRAAPSVQAATIKLAPDGTQLLVTGEGKEAEGAVWWPVRDPSDNQEGWADSTYLIP